MTKIFYLVIAIASTYVSFTYVDVPYFQFKCMFAFIMTVSLIIFVKYLQALGSMINQSIINTYDSPSVPENTKQKKDMHAEFREKGGTSYKGLFNVYGVKILNPKELEQVKAALAKNGGYVGKYADSIGKVTHEVKSMLQANNIPFKYDGTFMEWKPEE